MADDKREQILACACDLYLETGLDGFSMRKLASAVGVTAPALYRHYDSKEGIFVEMVSAGSERLLRYLFGSLAGETPEERFWLATEAYVQFALDYPQYFQMLTSLCDRLGRNDAPVELAQQTAMIGRFWDDRVRECINAGMLREDDLETVGLVLWAQAQGLLTLRLRGSLDELSRQQFKSLFVASMRRVLTGLATDDYASRLRSDGEVIGSLRSSPSEIRIANV